MAIRVKREDVARLRIMRGLRSDAALARKAQMHPQHLSDVLSQKVDPTLGTVSKICEALSLPGAPCRVEEILEYVPSWMVSPQKGAGTKAVRRKINTKS